MVVGNRIARYCDEHLRGTDYDLRRGDFNTPVNDEHHGYRRENREDFEIVRENFPITER